MKVLNAIVTFGALDQKLVHLEDRLIVPGNLSDKDFPPGSTVALLDLLHFSLMQSHNTAARLIAYHVGGALARQQDRPSQPRTNMRTFVTAMQSQANEIGLQGTVVTTPDGREAGQKKGRRGQTSTPFDLVRLFTAAHQFEGIVTIMRKDRHWCKNGLGNDTEVTHTSPNVSIFPETVCEKTGQTSQSHTGGLFHHSGRVFAYYVGGLWASKDANNWRFEDARRLIVAISDRCERQP